MTLSTYLTFNGNCKEAFEFYKSVFGGDFSMISTFGDGPPEMGASDGDKDRIMHVSLPIGESVLMGSDNMTEHSKGFQLGNNFSISFTPRSKAEADEIHSKIAEGGTVVMPMQDQFWGDYFGMCTDKFGVNWMINFSSS